MSRDPGLSGRARHQMESEDSTFSEGVIETATAALSLGEKLDPARKIGYTRDDTTYHETDDNFELTGSRDERLQKYMSFKTVISTSSSLARRNTSAAPNAAMHAIGKGSQGVVFEIPGSRECIKLQKGSLEALWNNLVMQTKVKEAFDHVAIKFGLEIDVQCPKVGGWINPGDAFWTENGHEVDWTNSGISEPKPGFKMERIFPVPEPLRAELINKYCPAPLIPSAKKDSKNKDCLIRVMLGKKDALSEDKFTLRNFRMDIERFADLKLPGDQYAEALGSAMAVIHWQAKLDGNDIEFVIGSSPEDPVRRQLTSTDLESMAVGTSTYVQVHGHTTPNFGRRVMAFWVMDFDQCKTITVDESGVMKAVGALQRNFYCPRHGSGREYQESLWKVFSARYLEVSKKILPKESHHLADLFISKIHRAA